MVIGFEGIQVPAMTEEEQHFHEENGRLQAQLYEAMDEALPDNSTLFRRKGLITSPRAIYLDDSQQWSFSWLMRYAAGGDNSQITLWTEEGFVNRSGEIHRLKDAKGTREFSASREGSFTPNPERYGHYLSESQKNTLLYAAIGTVALVKKACEYGATAVIPRSHEDGVTELASPQPAELEYAGESDHTVWMPDEPPTPPPAF